MEHNKRYTHQEILYRYNLFAQTYHKIEEHNKGNHSWKLKINQFADLTDDEFQQFYLAKHRYYPANDIDDEHSIEQISYEDVNIDWFTAKKVGRVKDQGMCGSCWAFGSIGAIEGAYAISKNVSVVEFSEQALMDCCKVGTRTDGCNGGEETDAFPFTTQNGVALSSAYPYEAYNDICRPYSPFYKNNNYTQVPSGDNAALITALSSHAVVIGVNAGSFHFRYYSSGILTGGCTSFDLDHSVLLVGAGVDSGTPYWKVKNSWGPQWGEQGLIRIYRDLDNKIALCGLNRDAKYPNY